MEKGCYLHKRGHLGGHVDDASQQFMESAMNRLGFSARTIADSKGSDKIATEHISEAIQYRSLDRRVS